MANNPANPLGLYLHIPFCASKCAYCDFYSLAASPLCEEKERYADALLLQMEDYATAARDHLIDTVFIGGGTPTLMPVKSMTEIISGISRNFHLSRDAEFTMEANPATVTLPMLKKYRKAGVNRLSFGLQSANGDELKALSRIHSYAEFVDSFGIARQAGFDNINVDLMFGIPHQTKKSLKHTLEAVCELGPEHISLYGLRIEEGTPFASVKDSLPLPDEDTEFEMYQFAVQVLASYGYEQYEISNFAKRGYECRHNLRYWNCEEYLGLGPGAHSYFNGMRFSFGKDLGKYMDVLEKQLPDAADQLTDEAYHITPSERVGEYIMLQLRLNHGLDTEDFQMRFQLDFEACYEKHLKLYTENGFMEHIGSRYCFTDKGRYVSNYILSAMLDFDSDIASGIRDGSST